MYKEGLWTDLTATLWDTNLWNQLGPQQLKYMTVLKDSSDCLAFSSLTLLEAMAEEEEESFWAWEQDLSLFLACWWIDLIA